MADTSVVIDEAGSPRSSVEDPRSVEDAVEQDALVEDEVLVEEISIDGMCGVY